MLIVGEGGEIIILYYKKRKLFMLTYKVIKQKLLGFYCACERYKLGGEWSDQSLVCKQLNKSTSGL